LKLIADVSETNVDLARRFPLFPKKGRLEAASFHLSIVPQQTIT